MSLFYQRQCHGCGQPCDGYYCESCMCPQCGMALFNGICNNCIYGTGMPIICTECGGIVRGGLCLPCDLREKDLYNYDPNAYSFDNSNYFPQPQDENYLCNLCGNNSHDGYDCQQQFPFVYKQEPSYNQKCDDNYYPHESLSFPCCDYYGGSHETFQCQPDNQNVDFSGSNQIQTPQYPDVNPPSPEISNEEIFQAKGDLMTSIQTFLEKFNCIPFEEKPQILFQIWETFFAIQSSQPEDSNELFQKLLKDLKELAEYDQSTRTDRPIFLNGDEGHSDEIADLEPEATTDTELSGTEDIHPLAIQEPPQDSDIFKNVEEQPAERRNRAEKSLQNFRVVHKSSISLKDTSQISSIHEVAPILSAKEPEHLLSMGYEHFSITPETESNAENLLPIPSKCEVTLEDEIKCDMPAKDVCSPVFTTFSNPFFKDNDDLDEDVPAEEFKIYSNPLCDEDKINSDKLDPHCFNIKYDFVESLLNRDTFINFSSKFDFSSELIQKSNFDFEEEIRLYNSFLRPPEELNAEIDDTIIESIPLPIPVQAGNSQQEEINIVTSSDDVLPSSDENDDDDYDLLLEEVDLFLSDDSIPPGIENVADDPEGDVRGEIFVSTKIKDDDYFPFMFVIRFFLPYFILPEISPLLLSAKSEDTLFDPGISD
nr:hypothetical protein [Tanacetum cinerariifolium]